jgi:hypothetical protein
VSSVANIGGGTYIQPTHWNDQHAAPMWRAYDFDPGLAPASFGIPSTAGASGMEFPNNTPLLRGAYDFTNVTNIYVAAVVASTFALGSTALRFQYAPSGFPGSWYSFDATGGSAPFVSVASGNNASMYLAGSNGAMFGPTAAVSAAAKALPQPLNVRLAGYGGNGSAPQLGPIDVFVT